MKAMVREQEKCVPIPEAQAERDIAEPKRVLRIDPNLLPDQYGMICEGKCLEPDIPDGTCLLFDKRLPFATGDLVVLYRRPELVAPGQHQGIVKRLVTNVPHWVKFPYRDHPKSDVRALIIAEQMNPRRQYAIPCEDLLAIHRCLGPVPPDMKRVRVTEEEIAAAAHAPTKDGKRA